MVQSSVTALSDQFLKRIYDSGKWSIISFFAIVILLQFNGSFIVYSWSFTAASIPFQCRVNENAQSYIIQNDSCSLFDVHGNESVQCSINYTFIPDKNFMQTSIISHFGLVCDRSNLDELAQSLVMAGLVIGGFIGPLTGDYFGRQKVMLSSTFLCGVVGILIAFSPNFLIFACGKFILGILREISMTSGFVLALEVIPSDKQCVFGMMYQFVWCLAMMAIGTISYFIRDWQYLQVAGSCPSLFAPILIIVISESPRWLISRGKVQDLEVVVKRYIKKWNRIKNDELEHLLTKMTISKDALLPNEHKKKGAQYNALDMFRSKYMIMWTSILTFTWIYSSTAAYSLSGITTLIAGDPFLNFCISAMMDAVGVIIAFYVAKVSRNVAVLSFQLVSAVSFLIAAFLPETLKYVTSCLIILGKLSLNGNLFVISISALYIYPSSLRIFGATISVTMGKIVAIGSPYFVELFKVRMWLPTTILGIMALLVGILNIFFPDWINKPLPETIEDVEMLRHHICLPCCHKERHRDKTYILLQN